MTTWSDQQTRELVSLWPKASVARRLERSRASVCRNAQWLRKDGVLPRGVIKHFEVVPVQARPHHARPEPASDTETQISPLEMRPCLLLELDDSRCHRPLGKIDEITTLFCGGSAAPRHRYCAHHSALAHG